MTKSNDPQGVCMAALLAFFALGLVALSSLFARPAIRYGADAYEQHVHAPRIRRMHAPRMRTVRPLPARTSTKDQK